LEDLLSPDLLREIDRFIFGIVRGWYRFQDRDFTLVDGLSLGNIHEFELIHGQTYPTEAFVATAGVAPFVRSFAQYKLLFESTPARIIYHDISEPAPLAALELVASKFSASLNLLQVQAPKTPPQKTSRNYSLIWRIKTGFRWRYQLLAEQSGNGIDRLMNHWRGRRFVQRFHEWIDKITNCRLGILIIDYPCLHDSMRLLEEKGFKIHTPDDCFRYTAMSADDPLAVTASHNELKRQWEQVRIAEEYRVRFNFMGISCWPFFDRFLSQLVNEQFPSTLHKAKQLRVAYRGRNIKAVLVPFDEPNLARLCIFIAQQLNVPDVVCLHGLTAYDGNANELMTASNVLVISEHDRQAVLRKRPHADVQVIGCLQTDQYLPFSHLETAKAHKPLRILILTYAPSTWSAATGSTSSELFLAHIVDALNLVKDPLQVTFKLHPSEERRSYEKALAILSPSFAYSIFDGWNLPELLPETDLVIGTVSTGFAEALALRKPAIFVNHFREAVPMAFTPEAGLRSASSKEELAAMLHEAARDYQSFLMNYDFETPGRYMGLSYEAASSKVVKIVETMIAATEH
jgi:hypothetical protein